MTRRCAHGDWLSRPVLCLLASFLAITLVLLSSRPALLSSTTAYVDKKEQNKQGLQQRPLPCVDTLLNLTRQQDKDIPPQWKQFLEWTIASSLTYEARDQWASTLNPVIIQDSETLKNRLEPLRVCPTRALNDNANVAIAAISNGAVANIQEWYFYYLLLGVERIFLCDFTDTNSAEQRTFRAASKPFVDAGYLHLIDAHKFDGLEWLQRQSACYNHIRKKHGDDFRWIGYFDTDEFVIPHSTDCLLDFLEEFKDYGGVTVIWNMFSMVGVQHHDPTKSYFEQYQYTFYDANYYFKSFIQPQRTTHMGIHDASFETGYYAVNTLHQAINRSASPRNWSQEAHFAKAELRHFFFNDLAAALFEKLCGKGPGRTRKMVIRWNDFFLPALKNSSLTKTPSLPPLHDALLLGLFGRT